MSKDELIKMLKNLVYTGIIAGIDRGKLYEFERQISELIVRRKRIEVYEIVGDKNQP